MNHEDEIRLIAYQIWEDEGHPDGVHVEHWIRAESIWQEQHSQAVAEPSWLKAGSTKKRAKARSRRSKR
jgi:hypothetical protein